MLTYEMKEKTLENDDDDKMKGEKLGQKMKECRKKRWKLHFYLLLMAGKKRHGNCWKGHINKRNPTKVRKDQDYFEVCVW